MRAELDSAARRLGSARRRGGSAAARAPRDASECRRHVGDRDRDRDRSGERRMPLLSPFLLTLLRGGGDGERLLRELSGERPERR